MNKLITLLVTLLISISSFAQVNGINYKALIKDSNGNVVANDIINVRFSIIKDTGPTVVYVENHTNKMTDANGIIILNIGEGTPVTNTFASIVWGSDTHSLKTEIDIEQDASFENMGTTPFKAVPYALQAKNVAFNTVNNVTSNAPGDLVTDNFVFGSNQLDDMAGFTDNSKMFFNKAKGAFRAGNTNGSDWDDVNIGEKSAALGLETKASAEASMAFGASTQATAFAATSMGFETFASGVMSLATGHGTYATGFGSFTTGEETTASGSYAAALGFSTQAGSFTSVSLGRYNIGGGNPTEWTETDPLFEIGIGVDDANRSNAITVFKDGGITAPNFTIAEIDNYGNSSLVTKQYTDDAYAPKLQTTTVIIPHAEFVPASPGNNLYLINGIAFFLQGDTRLIAPVEIPIGSTITSIRAYVRDGVNDNYDFSLAQQALNGFVQNTIFTLTTNVTIGIQELTYSNPIFIQDFSQYYIIIKPNMGSSWSLQGLAGIQGVRITYTN